MRTLLSIIFFLFFFGGSNTFAQGSWVNFNSPDSSFTLQLPSSGFHTFTSDSFDLFMLSLNIDSGIDSSNLAMQAYDFGSDSIGGSNEIWDTALSLESGDTLRAIAHVLVTLTNSNLLSYSSIDTLIGGISYKGLDIGLQYADSAFNNNIVTFSRIFLHSGKFFSISITGKETDITRVEDYRDLFFASFLFLD